MDTQRNPSPAIAETPSPSAVGLSLRNNLSSAGTLPTNGPYSQCPDIIGSSTILTNPAQTLSTPASWHQLYSVQPVPGSPTYYYVRGINNSSGAVQVQANLYYAPANLLLHPGTWQHNTLSTSGGSDSVDITAADKAIGVSTDPFVWTDAPASPQGSDFYSLVARVSSTDDPNPIPTISSWLDMGALLTQNLNYGFRTTGHVDGSSVGWCQWLAFSMPDGISNPGQLTFSVTANGMTGCTVTLFANTLLPNADALLFGPQPISSSMFTSGVSATLQAGFNSTIAVVCSNPLGQPIASGSTLTVAVSYAVPTEELDDAIDRKLLHNQYLHWEPTSVGVQPQPVVLLGEATFIVT